MGDLTDKMFHFTCFNVEDPDDSAVGLVNGEVTIPGNLLRREVFDPVVNQVRLAELLIVGRTSWYSRSCCSRSQFPEYVTYGIMSLLPRAGFGTHRSSDEEGRSTPRRPPSRGRFLR